jgi:hypothetical protein
MLERVSILHCQLPHDLLNVKIDEPMLNAVGQLGSTVDALAFYDIGDVMRQNVVNLLKGQGIGP